MDILFEDFSLDLARREFTKGGIEVVLEPQVFDLLAYLLCQRERVIDKDELVRHVWKGRIVSDSTIESRLSVLRRALNDDGRSQRLIRTYARKGVRFVGTVKESGINGAAPVVFTQAPLTTARSPEPWTSQRPSVAVIPFDNLSGNPSQDHLAEGIAADIIGLLTRSRTLFVLARNAGFSLKRSNPNRVVMMQEVDYVVEGTLRCAHGHFRVSFQLVDTRHGYAVLAANYDCALDDIFAIQDDIAEKIAGRIEPEIGHFTRRRIVRNPPRSLQAWDHFHLGMSHLYRATSEDNRAAQVWLRRAVEADPHFSLAQAFLSYAIVLSMIYFEASPEASLLEEALKVACSAVEIDDEDATVRFALGRALTVNGQYDDAIAEMTGATTLNPALAIAFCGLADSYTYLGDFERADVLFQHAIDLSPHDPMRWAFLSYRAQAKLFAGDFARAYAFASLAMRMPNCHYWPLVHRLAALGHLDADEVEVTQAREKLLDLKPDFNCSWARERLFYVKDARQLSIYVEGLRRSGIPDANC